MQTNRINIQRATIVCIDLAKNSFHVHTVDQDGNEVFSKAVNRSKLTKTVATLSACLVAMETCGGAHHWARTFQRFGHDVKLIAPQFVKPCVKSNKKDGNAQISMMAWATRAQREAGYMTATFLLPTPKPALPKRG